MTDGNIELEKFSYDWLDHRIKEPKSEIQVNYDKYTFSIWYKESIEKLMQYFENSLNFIKNHSEEWIELGNTPISEYCLENAIKLTEFIQSEIWYLNIDLTIPEILPCSDGTINVNWEMPDYNLLINIPLNEKGRIDYYGKNLLEPEKNIVGKSPEFLFKEMIIKWLKMTHVPG